MRPLLSRRVILLSVAGLLLAALLAGAAYVAVQPLLLGPTVAYPGATLTAEHTRRQWLPTYYFRRDTAYQSSAPFLDIYY